MKRWLCILLMLLIITPIWGMINREDLHFYYDDYEMSVALFGENYLPCTQYYTIMFSDAEESYRKSGYNVVSDIRVKFMVFNNSEEGKLRTSLEDTAVTLMISSDALDGEYKVIAIDEDGKETMLDDLDDESSSITIKTSNLYHYVIVEEQKNTVSIITSLLVIVVVIVAFIANFYLRHKVDTMA